MRRLVLAVLALAALLTGCYGAHSSGSPETPHYEQGLVDKAAVVVRGMRQDPKFRHIEVYLKNAKGVLVLPSVIKAGTTEPGAPRPSTPWAAAASACRSACRRRPSCSCS